MFMTFENITTQSFKKWIPYKIQFFIKYLFSFEELHATIQFVLRRDLPLDRKVRLSYLRSIYMISYHVDCAHSQSEILECVTALLLMPDSTKGYLVEAGCYKGGSAAKFSLAARLTGRKFAAFDSFEGLPENNESHGKTIFGDTARFDKGLYLGSLDDVQHNVREYGAIENCSFNKGWFENTMPHFSQPIVVAYLDVDLVSSTRTCLKYLYPLLQPGGAIYSQDAHLPLIISLLQDDQFWETEVGCVRPKIEGLGKNKLVRISK